MPPATQTDLPPPTIASLKEHGVEGVIVTCDFCPGRSARPRWSDLGMPDETLFPRIGRLKRFRCESCGNPGSIMPDWSGMYEQHWKMKAG